MFQHLEEQLARRSTPKPVVRRGAPSTKPRDRFQSSAEHRLPVPAVTVPTAYAPRHRADVAAR